MVAHDACRESWGESPFELCPQCGALTLVRVWHGSLSSLEARERGDTERKAAHWEELAVPLSPVFGLPHQCQGQEVK